MGKNLAAWAIIVVFLLAIFNLFQDNKSPNSKVSLSYSEFLAQVELDNINDVTSQENKISDHSQ